MKKWEKIKKLLETPERMEKIQTLFDLLEDERREGIEEGIERSKIYIKQLEKSQKKSKKRLDSDKER